MHVFANAKLVYWQWIIFFLDVTSGNLSFVLSENVAIIVPCARPGRVPTMKVFLQQALVCFVNHAVYVHQKKWMTIFTFIMGFPHASHSVLHLSRTLVHKCIAQKNGITHFTMRNRFPLFKGRVSLLPQPACSATGIRGLFCLTFDPVSSPRPS